MGRLPPRSDRRGGMTGPHNGSPPALGAEGRATAVGAIAEPAYTIEASRAILQATVSALIDVLDFMGGDPDVEPNSDELDQSYPEAAGPRGHVIAGRASAIEDAEDDDEDCGRDEGEPDFSRVTIDAGPGCPIADPGEDGDGL